MHHGRVTVAGTELARLLPESERLLFHSESVCIGQVRCPPTAPHFRNCGEARTFCIVFPRSAVSIHRPGSPPYIEDPTVVGFYNRAQEYERYEVSPEGDRCDWFGFPAGAVRDAVSLFDPTAASDERRPWRFNAARSSAAVYRQQRLLFEQVRTDGAIDPLYVDEAAIAILGQVVAEAYAPDRQVDPPSRRSRELAEATRRLLARAYDQPLSLAQIARALATSAFHLCHVFRRVEGTSIHRYRLELRLRRAVERVADPAVDVGQVAFDLGFSTHSHFTAAFRRAFGTTPSAMRFRLTRSGRSEQILQGRSHTIARERHRFRR